MPFLERAVEIPVLGRDERVFRGMVFVKLSKISFRCFR